MKYFPIFLLSLIAVLFFTACERETDNITTQEALDAIEDYATAQKLFSDATDEADNAARVTDDSLDNRGNSQAHPRSGDEDYPIISISPFDNTWPKTIRIDYGEENYLCYDQRYRRGIINIEASDFYRNEGSQLTTTFEDYYQNDYKVEGTRIVTNNGENGDGNLTFTLDLNDGHILTPEGTHIYYEENTTREWIDGESTLLNPWDDVYLVRGTQEGISSDSIEYSLSVHSDDPLDVMVQCRWVRAGLLDVDIETLPTITIDYGDGECDNAATATINGDDYPFSMQ